MLVYEKVSFGSECNNRCVTCPSVRQQEPPRLNELVAQVDALKNGENLELFGGEPTLHEDLLSLISYARRKGARRIKLVTNGRRLADESFLLSLVEEGCRIFDIKLYGSRPETHDAVTRVRGSLDEMLQGLQNLGGVSDAGGYEGDIYVGIRFGVTNTNLEDLVPAVALLISFSTDAIRFVRMGGDFPIVQAAQMVANAMKVAALNRVWSMCEGFPPCVMKGSETHLSELLQPVAFENDKPKSCLKCIFAKICTGPPGDYAGKGLRDFKAVSASPYSKDMEYLLKMRSIHAKQ